MNMCRPFALSSPHFSKETKPESDLQFLYRRFDRSFARNFPNAYRYYRFAIDGGNSCWFDVKTYFRIRQALWKKERTLADLSIQELLIYIQTRESLIKLVPLAIIMVTPGVMPFLIYVVPGGIPLIIFLMVLFPNFVLTRHFWTEAQTQTYHGRELAKRAHFLFPKIIDYLKQQSKNPEQFKRLPISINELLQFPLPSLDQISFFHQFYLKRLHKVSTFSIGDKSLLLRAQLMQLLDEKMASNKEMINKMNAAELRLHLYLRKLNFEYTLDDDKITASMRSLLKKWLDNTQGLSTSAYIHAPILIQARPDQFSKGKAAFWEPEEIQKKLEGMGKEASKWSEKFKKK